MISRKGIFAADNPEEFGKRPVARYVIFLTDGDMEPSSTSGSAYGVERLDRKVMGGAYNAAVSDGKNTELSRRHDRRFVMACNLAKQSGASIWTIAFGLSVPQTLEDCASSEDQVSTSANSADLIAKFKEIGKNIGALRLSQ